MVLALQFSEHQFEAFIAKQKFPPNEFQMEILRSLAFERQNLLVNALAGSGKTSLLMQAADLLKEMGVRPSDAMFLAFNTKIRDEMNERLPPGFTAINSHKLGNSVLAATRKTKVAFKKYRDICKPIASRMGYVKNNYVAYSFLENLCSKAMMSNIKLFDLSESEREALPDKLMVIVDHYSLGGRTDEEDEADNSKMIDDMISCVPEVMMKAKSHWELTGEVTFDEMIYYPIALNLPIQKVKYVFVDECQDLNVVQQQLAIRSCAPGGTMIWVGDVRQCVIEGTLIDKTPIENIKEWDTVHAARGRNRVEKAVVTGTETRYVENEPVITVRTRSGKELTTTFNHMHFADYLAAYGDIYPHFVYLMYRENMGYRVGVTRKYTYGSSKLPLGYMGRSNGEKADSVWVLHACESEVKARFYEALYAARYKLPTIPFKARKGSGKVGNSLVVDQPFINNLYAEIDTYTGADQILSDMGMMSEYPHHIPKCMTTRRRRNVSVIFCGDSRSNTMFHQLELSGSDEEDANTLKSAGFNVTDNGKGTGWRVRQVTRDAATLHVWIRTIEQIMPVNVIRKAKFGKKSLKFTPASHVRVGMMIYVQNDEGEIVLDEIVSVTHNTYTGNVHELDVSKLHNYIANGIVTHNSIYGFAGADARSFNNIQKLTDAKVLPLNINYRCGTKHLDLARAIVPQIVAHDGAIEGTVTYVDADESPSKVLKKGSLVLCRLTAPLVKTYFQLIAELVTMDKEKRVPVKVLGKDIAKDLSGILDKTSKIPGFSYINIVKFLTQYQERQRAFLEQKEAPESQLTKLDDSIEVLIVCVENFLQCASLTCLKEELKGLFGDEKDKGYKQDDYITLLTIHRAKGLEADQVAILKPDKMPLVWKGQQDWEFEQEMNILYVALTRPRKELIVFGGGLNVGAKPGADTNSRSLDNIIIKEEVLEDVTDPLLAFIRIDEVEELGYRAIEAEAKRLDANNLLSGSQLSTDVIRGKNEQSKPELTVLPKPEPVTDTASISEEPPPPSIEDIEKMESELPAVDIEPVADIGFAPIDDSLVSFKSHDDVEAVTVTNGVVDAPEPYKQYSILDMASAAKEAKRQKSLKSTPAPEPVVDMNQPEKKIIEDVRQAQKSLFDNASVSKSQVDEPISEPEPIPMPKVKASGDLQKDMKAVKKQKAVHAKHRTVTEVLTGISDVQQIDTLIELLQARRGELVAEA